MLYVPNCFDGRPSLRADLRIGDTDSEISWSVAQMVMRYGSGGRSGRKKIRQRLLMKPEMKTCHFDNLNITKVVGSWPDSRDALRPAAREGGCFVGT
jgi:hypothetical protein